MTPRERILEFLKIPKDLEDFMLDPAAKMGVDAFEKIINAAVAQERERCAKIIYAAKPKVEYLEGDDFIEEVDKSDILFQVFQIEDKFSDDHPNRKALADFYKKND